MESGGSSSSKHRHTRRVPKSGIVIQEPDVTTNNPIDDSNNLNLQRYLPIANVTRIMRRILPANAKIADDAKETVQECVTEFISFITNEANEKCHRECRKTISPEDILWAMRTLGFDNYIEPLIVFLSKYRAQDPERSVMHHMPLSMCNVGIIQQPAAQLAHQPLVAPPLTPMDYTTTMPPPHGIDGNDYIELPHIADSFVGNQGGGESSCSRAFRQFK